MEKGKLADMIVVSGNPLEEIGKTRDIKIVIKDGWIIILGHMYYCQEADPCRLDFTEEEHAFDCPNRPSNCT